MDPGRYARLEDEQRYVITAVPDGAGDPRLVEDRYLRGTNLRLRRVTDADGIVRKLGHKRRLDEVRPSAVWHTTMYLEASEFDLLAALDADVLRKRRWTTHGGGAADEFLDALTGLVLLEGARPHPGPPAAIEVTDDERFSGGSLAALDDAGATALVADARRMAP
jgi:hypothetical protein